MEDRIIRAIGTLFFGGFLFNWIIPLWVAIVGLAKENNSYNLVVKLGGKIGRKWFLINELILIIALLIITGLCVAFKNLVMFLVCIPYFIAFYLLHWNNAYKRINSITNAPKFSLVFVIIWALYALWFSTFGRSMSLDFRLISGLIAIIICFLLFVLPERKKNEQS